MKSGNLNFLETSGSLQACNGTALPYIYNNKKWTQNDMKEFDKRKSMCSCPVTVSLNVVSLLAFLSSTFYGWF